MYKSSNSNLEQESNNIERVLIIAKRQRALLLAFFIYLVIAVLLFNVTNAYKFTNSELQAFRLLLLVPILAVITFTARLCWKLYEKGSAITMIIFSALPVANLFVLLLANSKASKLIKNQGFRVGLMGANTKEIAKVYTGH